MAERNLVSPSKQETYREAFSKFYLSELEKIAKLFQQNKLKEVEPLLKQLQHRTESDLVKFQTAQPFLRSVRAQLYEAEAKLVVCHSPVWGLARSGMLEEKLLLKEELTKSESKVKELYKKARAELTLAQKESPQIAGQLTAGINGLSRAESELKRFLLFSVAREQIVALERGKTTLSEYVKNAKGKERYFDVKSQGIFEDWITNLSGTADRIKQDKKEFIDRRTAAANSLENLECVKLPHLSSLKEADPKVRRTFSEKLIRSELNQLLSVDTRFLDSAGLRAEKNTNHQASVRWDEIAEWYTNVKDATRTVLVGGVAVYATGGVAGIVMGLGWGSGATAAGLAGAVAVGTAAGTTSGAVFTVAEEESMIAQGMKRREDAYKELPDNLAKDGKSAFYASIGTAAGVLAAARIGAGLGEVAVATNRGRRLIGVGAGVSGGTTSTTLQLGEEYTRATTNFFTDSKVLESSLPEVLEKYKTHLEANGLSYSDVSKRFLLMFITSSLGALSGVRADRLRESAKSELRVLLSTTEEAGANFAIGAGSSVIETGKFDAAQIISNTGDSLTGAMQAHAGLQAQRRTNSATLNHDTAQIERSQKTGDLGSLKYSPDPIPAPRSNWSNEPVVITLPGFAAAKHMTAEKIETILRDSSRIKGELIIEMGSLHEAHPVQQETTAILNKLLKTMSYKIPEGVRPEVIVTQAGQGVQGFTLPNGSIFVTPELLSIIKTKDELAAFLSHELIHSLEGHVLKQYAEISEDPVKELRRKVGIMRLGEYEGDILGMTEILSKSGYSPLAMDTLLERLRQHQGGRTGWDIEHGSLLDRRLNILSLSTQIDLEGSAKVQKPLSSEFTKVVSELPVTKNNNFLALTSQGDTFAISQVIDGLQLNLDDSQLVLRQRALVSLERLLLKDAQELPGEDKSKVEKIRLGERLEITVNTKNGSARRLEQRNQILKTTLEQVLGDGGAAADPTAAVLLTSYLCDRDPFKSVTIGKRKASGLEVNDLQLDQRTWLSSSLYNQLEENGIGESFSVALSSPALNQRPILDRINSENLRERAKNFLEYAHREADLFSDPDTEEVDLKRFYNEAKKIAQAVKDFEKRHGLQADLLRPLDYELISSILKPAEFNRLKNVVPNLESEWESSLRQDEQHARAREPKSELDILLDKFVTSLPEARKTDPEERKRVVVKLRHNAKKRRDESGVELIDYLAKDPERRTEEYLDALTMREDRAQLLDHLFIISPMIEESIRIGVSNNENISSSIRAVDSLLIGFKRISEESSLSSTEASDLAGITIRLIQVSQEGKPGRIDIHGFEILADLERRYGKYSTSLSHRLNEHDFLVNSTVKRLYEIAQLHPKEAFSALKAITDIYDFTLDSSTGKLNSRSSIDENHFISDSQACIRILKNEIQSPSDLIVLSSLFISPERRMKLRNYAYQELAKSMSFNEASELLSKPGQVFSAELSPVVEAMTERLAKTPKQLARASDIIRDLYRRSANQEISTIVAVDERLSFGRYNHSEILDAGISSRESPRALTELAFSVWYDRLRTVLGAQNDPFEMTDAGYTGLDTWSKVTPQEAIRAQLAPIELEETGKASSLALKIISEGWSVPKILTEIYSLSAIERGVLIRKLLTAEKGGVFHSDDATKKLLLSFLVNNITEFDSKNALFSSILESFVERTTVEDRYLLTAAPLVGLTFQEPFSPTDPLLIIRRDEHFRELNGEYRSFLKREGLEYDPTNNHLEKKIQSWAFPKNPDSQLMRAEVELFETIPEDYRKFQRRGQLTPAEGIIEAARQFRGPGIRALQILPQYLALSQEQKRQFASVYDREKGQSKMAAYHTVKREAPHLLNPKAEFGDQIAGGSQVTVYDYRDEQGRQWVLKVLNPNAERFASENINLAERVLERLVEKEPNDEKVKLIKEQLLPDLKEWMVNEINDQRFLELDKAYRKKWEGFKADKKSKFSIKIPESHPSTGKFVKLDEKIDGKTLTQFKIGDKTDYEAGVVSREDWKEISNLIQVHYTEQLKNGVAHSNPTPGNFMLTKDNKLAVIDRSFFLEFSITDRMILAGLQTGFTAKSAISKFVEMVSQERGVPVNPELVKEIQQIYEIGKKTGKPNSDILQESLLRMKELGLRVPLRFTLLGLNFGALEFIEQFPERINK